MNKRCCLECGKSVKSLSGLSRHMYRCPVVIGKKTSVVKNIPAKSSRYSSKSDSNEQTDSDWIGLDKVTARTDGIDDSEWIDFNEETTSSPKSIHGIQSRLSTTASIRVDLYEEVTGKKAGQIVDDSDDRSSDRSSDRCSGRSGDRSGGRSSGRSCGRRGYKRETPRRSPEHSSKYHPFQSETDFALAQWFLSAKCTKGDIERFYGDSRLGPIHQLLSFSSHNELMSKIHNIPHGIPDDIWNISEIEVEQEIIGLAPSTYQIRYRDIVKVLRFLIGHEPFKHHLSYAPVRQFSGAGIDNQIYDEMHTANWWWRTQEEIPDGGTIIPILLASDKTMLSLHHGDQSVWPIYITIGNLDRKTRRNQTVPGSILLGFLPITSETADESKAHVYHAAMELILKRK
jgi:Plavaka transposase